MKKFIVNLNEATDRWAHIQKYNLKDATRIVPVPLDDPELLDMFQKTKKSNHKELKRKQEISNILTLRNIILKAKEENLPMFLRLEDDVEFLYDPEIILDKISTLPKDFAICHLGVYFRNVAKGQLKKYNEHFIELGPDLKTWAYKQW